MSAFNFSLSGIPQIIFGNGVRLRLTEILKPFGKHVLFVMGARHVQESAHWLEMQRDLKAADIRWQIATIDAEPSPDLIDRLVIEFRNSKIDAVVGLGGGSALDAAKAIAGLLKPGNSIMDHLEGVGPELPYQGPAIPLIAIPTTAGTGSEATKNAVLSLPGENGFKKSFRDERLFAKFALIDPELLSTCPPKIIAANGMDALTQLLESFVSSKANRLSDALAWDGLQAVNDGLLDWYRHGQTAHDSQAKMAYAALLSGITLAHVGLGSVHGLAAPLGAFFPIPHGVACGTLVAEATDINIRAVRERGNKETLEKYAKVGRLLSQDTHLSDEEGLIHLVNELRKWTTEMKLQRLSEFGVQASDLPRLVANSRGNSMKTNPVLLSNEEISEILARRL